MTDTFESLAEEHECGDGPTVLGRLCRLLARGIVGAPTSQEALDARDKRNNADSFARIRISQEKLGSDVYILPWLGKSMQTTVADEHGTAYPVTLDYSLRTVERHGVRLRIPVLRLSDEAEVPHGTPSVLVEDLIDQRNRVTGERDSLLLAMRTVAADRDAQRDRAVKLFDDLRAANDKLAAIERAMGRT